MTTVIAVDKKDNILGLVSKEKVHKLDGILHRAFSVFVINTGGGILLQRRSKNKKLWPGYWSNTCCSHPKEGETVREAGERRLKEELGFTCKLKPLFKFYYHALYQNKGSENELCTVLLGRSGLAGVKPNRREVASFKWISLPELKRDIEKSPEMFTPWLRKIIGDVRFTIIKSEKSKVKNK